MKPPDGYRVPAKTHAETCALVERVQQGDAQALTRLVTRYYPRIRRIVDVRTGGRLREAFELDDLVQEVLLRVLRGLETFELRSDALFIQWVSRLASNELRDRARWAERRQAETPEESVLRSRLAEETRGVASRVGGVEEEELLDSCLAELDEHYREVLLLRDYAGASWDEVQAELQRPSVNACQALHQRARRALKERLVRRGVG